MQFLHWSADYLFVSDVSSVLLKHLKIIHMYSKANNETGGDTCGRYDWLLALHDIWFWLQVASLLQ